MLVGNILRRRQGSALLQQIGRKLCLTPNPVARLDLPAQTDCFRLQGRARCGALPPAQQRLMGNAEGPLGADQQSGLGHLVDELRRRAAGNEGGAIRGANGETAVLIDVGDQHAQQRIEGRLRLRRNGREHLLGMGCNGALEAANGLIRAVGQGLALARREQLSERHL